jgi:hypothetical protein
MREAEFSAALAVTIARCNKTAHSRHYTVLFDVVACSGDCQVVEEKCSSRRVKLHHHYYYKPLVFYSLRHYPHHASLILYH